MQAIEYAQRCANMLPWGPGTNEGQPAMPFECTAKAGLNVPDAYHQGAPGIAEEALQT